MHRRDFLTSLGVGAFACAVHNVPKVLAPPPNIVRFTVNNIKSGDRVLLMHGSPGFTTIDLYSGDELWNKQIESERKQPLADMWSRHALETLNQSMISAKQAVRDFGDAAQHLGDTIGTTKLFA